jgi:hypothetical protein
MKDTNEDLLKDLAPRPKREKRVHKYHSTKGLPVINAVRRQAGAEASAENPLPRLQKDAIFMKYGVIPTVIEREILLPLWKNEMMFQLSEDKVEVVWNRMLQNWRHETQGLRRRDSDRGFTRSVPTVNSNRQTPPTNPRSRRPELGTLKPMRPMDNRYPNLPASRVVPYPKVFSENLKRSSAPMDKSTRSPQN